MKSTKKIALFVALLSFINFPLGNAHSYLTSSNPKAGSIIAKLPQQVRLTFNENLLIIKNTRPNSISVTSASGVAIRQGEIVVSKNSLAVFISSKDRVSGKLNVTYRAVSADGHPITGKFTFTVK
jgi:methionine-rich copper-binding protein CopC